MWINGVLREATLKLLFPSLFLLNNNKQARLLSDSKCCLTLTQIQYQTKAKKRSKYFRTFHAYLINSDYI